MRCEFKLNSITRPRLFDGKIRKFIFAHALMRHGSDPRQQLDDVAGLSTLPVRLCCNPTIPARLAEYPTAPNRPDHGRSATLAFRLFLDQSGVDSRRSRMVCRRPSTINTSAQRTQEQHRDMQRALFGHRRLVRLSEAREGGGGGAIESPASFVGASPVRLSPLGLPPAPPVPGFCHPFRKGYIQHRLELLLRLFRADYAFQKEEFAPE